MITMKATARLTVAAMTFSLAVATAAAQTTPVRVGGDVKEPTKIKHVAPIYPQLAVNAKIEGSVILELLIDKTGAVAGVKVLRTIPLLEQVAVDAVRQWKYEPTKLNDEPVEILLIVSVVFRVADQALVRVADAEPVRVGGDIIEPQKIKHVAPTYPQDAMQDKVQGAVILEALITRTGTVKSLKILREVDSRLAKAAIAAVEQWEYTPTTLSGVPVEVLLIVNVRFQLK